MLARLLALHPDIVKQRPLDQRSDIWSLGKAFVEILTADPDEAELQERADALPVPQEVRTLIRLMLSDDPDLRPQSMAEVAVTLGHVSDRAIQEAVEGYRLTGAGMAQAILRRVNLRLGLLAALLIALIVAGGLLWYRFEWGRRDSDEALIAYANRYAGAVAFVVADYWLKQGGREIYHRRSEGTAFLADDAGYLLTNRHVACPWLEDSHLMVIIGLLRQRPEPLEFGHSHYLWFEGQRGGGPHTSRGVWQSYYRFLVSPAQPVFDGS